MNERKSFNKEALRGNNYDDLQWQKDFADATGIVIPDKYLYTSAGPKYAINKMYEQNIIDFMQHEDLTESQAKRKANVRKTAALNDLKELIK